MAGAPVALAGRVMGAMPGFFAQDPTQTIMGGALGAGGAGLASLAGRGLTALGRSPNINGPAAATAPVVPSAEDLAKVGGAQFDALRNSGATFDPAAVRGGANTV